jgi:predicted  nucleic acid-binding Zn-ribbon protein
MKIKRFNEATQDQLDISPERAGEMIESLKDSLSIIEDKNKSVESMISELENYKSKSKKGNDQIDDSMAALQIVKKSLDEAVDKIDTVISNLMDYNDEGRKYLYTENK